MSIPLSVLIPDGEKVLALYVARCLAQVRQVKLYVLSSKPRTWCQFSRHRQLYKFQPIETDLEERLKTTVEFIKQYDINVILPVSDEGFEFVATKYQDLSE